MSGTNNNPRSTSTFESQKSTNMGPSNNTTQPAMNINNDEVDTLLECKKVLDNAGVKNNVKMNLLLASEKNSKMIEKILSEGLTVPDKYI